MDPDECSVQVALRVRPMMGAEKEINCKSVLRAEREQIFIGLENPRPFTFDYVFDSHSDQKTVYSECVSALVQNYLEGYNATILAYGQTGSGKTHTMGTACNEGVQKEDFGILPRVIEDIFDRVDNDPSRQFKVSVQFLEIHNQDINDLLVHSSPAFAPISPSTTAAKKNSRQKSEIAIREQPNGEIIVTGVTEHQVQTREEMMLCLDRGSMARTTGSTNMNAVSSRSHAIFTVFLTQKTVVMQTDEDNGSQSNNSSNNNMLKENEQNILTSKFHFVDLAGSERLKRTGATGERREEGISINSGLLALGNVISALADTKKKGEHVPFRDSKITRLLQDSLGGNSKTLMIACVSPADINAEETVSTLKYANRARNIKNKVVINRDPNLIKLDKMRARIVELEQAMKDAGVPLPEGGGSSSSNKINNNTTSATTTRSSSSSSSSSSSAGDKQEITLLKKENDLLFQDYTRLQTKQKEMRTQYEDILKHVKNIENQLILYKQGIHSLEGGSALACQLEGSDNFSLADADDFKLIYVQQRKIIKLKEKNRVLQQQPLPQQQASSASSSPASLNTSISSEISEAMSDMSDEEGEKGGEKDRDRERGGGGEKGPSYSHDDSFDEELENTRSQQRQYVIQQLQNQDAHLTSQLAEKEDAVRILSEAKQKEIELTQKITEMEAEVERIQLEKEKALKELDKNAYDSKYKEQVKTQSKQLADLRAQIAQLREKLKESENIKRSYEKKGLQLKQLQQEIDDVKRQRVKLAKEITEKSEAHREAMKTQENAMKRMTKETREAKLVMQKCQEMLSKKETILKRETEKNLFLQKQILGQETKRQNARMQRMNLQQALHAQATETPARKRRAEKSPTARKVEVKNSSSSSSSSSNIPRPSSSATSIFSDQTVLQTPKRRSISKIKQPSEASSSSSSPPPLEAPTRLKEPSYQQLQTKLLEAQKQIEQLTKTKETTTTATTGVISGGAGGETNDLEDNAFTTGDDLSTNVITEEDAMKYKIRYTKVSKRLTELEKKEKSQKMELERARNELVIANADIRERDKEINALKKRGGNIAPALLKELQPMDRQCFSSLNPNTLSMTSSSAELNKENRSPAW